MSSYAQGMPVQGHQDIHYIYTVILTVLFQVKKMGFDQQTKELIRNHTFNSKILNSKRLTHDWVRVPNSTDLFVYSAFREWNQIRIVGTSFQKNSTEKSLFCNMWRYDVEGNTKISTTQAQHIIIPDTHGRR